MKWFKIEELIRCYRKDGRCKECKLVQRAERLPYGVEENIASLVENVLDPVRERLGKPITVNSGFRCPLHNKTVGGATGSQHMRGEAADLRIDGKPEALAKVIVANGKWDQLILYPGFVHVSWKRGGLNRREVLKKTSTGYLKIAPSEL